jgi:hypothetical protein
VSAVHANASNSLRLRVHHCEHCKLTARPPAVAAPKRAPQQAGDLYMGLLYSTEDFHVFGCAALSWRSLCRRAAFCCCMWAHPNYRAMLRSRLHQVPDKHARQADHCGG